MQSNDEERTHHYLGKYYGFGPVKSSEYVCLFIFDTNQVASDEVTPALFDLKKLKRCNQSVARPSYLTRGAFDTEINRDGTGANGKVTGYSFAEVGQIRKLKTWMPKSDSLQRGVVVLDSVDSSDYQAHAVLGFFPQSESTIKGDERARFFARLVVDLSTKFSKIFEIDSVQFASEEQYYRGRLMSMISASIQP